MNVGTAVVLIRSDMNRADAFGQNHVLHSSLRWRSARPSVIVAARDAENLAHRTHRKLGLIRVHEFEEFPFLPANQAVAFARMSRSVWSLRTWRRRRASSSRSALLKRSLLALGLPPSMAACAIQLRIDCAEQPNSSASS